MGLFKKEREPIEAIPDPMFGERAEAAKVRAVFRGDTHYDLEMALSGERWELEVGGGRQLGAEELALIQGFVASLERVLRNDDPKGVMRVLRMPVREARRRKAENMSFFEKQALVLNPELVDERWRTFSRVAKRCFRPFKRRKKEFKLEDMAGRGKPYGLVKERGGKLVITTMDQSLIRWLKVGFLIWMNPRLVEAEIKPRPNERVKVKVKKVLPKDMADNFIEIDEEGIRIYDPSRGMNGELYRWGDASRNLVFRIDVDPRVSDKLNALKALIGKRKQTALFGVLKIVDPRDGNVLTEIPMVRPDRWVGSFEKVRETMEELVGRQLEAIEKETRGQVPLFPRDFYRAIPGYLQEAILDVLGQERVVSPRRRRIRVRQSDGSYRDTSIAEAFRLLGETFYDREEYLKRVALVIAEQEEEKLSKTRLGQLKYFIAKIVAWIYEEKTGRKLKLGKEWKKKSLEELKEEFFKALDTRAGRIEERVDRVDGTVYHVWREGESR